MEAREVEVSNLKSEIQKEKEKVKETWRLNCEQLAQYDAESMAKEAEITSLKEKLGELETSSLHETDVIHSPVPTRRGKASPIDAFTGDDVETQFDDWLPTLDRAASWNNWSDE